MARKIINPDVPPLVWSTVDQAFKDINDNFTEIYLNIGGTDSSNPVDLTSLNTDLIPGENGVYNLGSEFDGWQELFLTSRIRFSDTAAITVNDGGGSIDLPEGSTIGGELIKDPAASSFKTIATSGQTDIVADDVNGILNFAGDAISFTTNPATDTLTIVNAGVKSLLAGDGVSVSSATGDITVANTGVREAQAGDGISVSSGTGIVTFSNTGVLEVTADTGIQIFDDGGGSFRIRNSGVIAPQNLFERVSVTGQSDVVADSIADTLNFVGGNGVSITTNPTVDEITFTNTGVTSLAASTGVSVDTSTGGVTITNTGVTSLAAGTGISVDTSTGSVTVTNTRLGFTSFAVAGQDPILADTSTDTMVFVAGDGIILETDAGTDSLTVSVDVASLEINNTLNVAVVGDDSVITSIPIDQTLTFVAGDNITLSSDSTSGVITISSTAVSVGGGGGSGFELNVAADDSTVYPFNTGNTLQIDGTGGITTTVTADGTFTIDGSGVQGLASRTTISDTTTSIADGADEDLDITGFKGYLLLKIQTDAAAWVRVYTDAASRTADAGRSELTDPDPGAGVVAEVITSGAETILISPGAFGFNNEGTPTTNVPINVKNKSGGNAAITVTLTVIQVEA